MHHNTGKRYLSRNRLGSLWGLGLEKRLAWKLVDAGLTDRREVADLALDELQERCDDLNDEDGITIITTTRSALR